MPHDEHNCNKGPMNSVPRYFSGQRSASCYLKGGGSSSVYVHGHAPGSELTKQMGDIGYLKAKESGHLFAFQERSYNDVFKSMAEDYFKGEGKNLKSYLSSQGKTASVRDYGTANLGDDKTIASLLTYNNNGRKESVMLGNSYGMGFQSRLERMASKYGLSQKEAFEYAMVHETMHAAGYNSEIATEMATREFFNYMKSKSDVKREAKYQKLAKTADRRIGELNQLKQEGLENYIAKHYYTHGKSGMNAGNCAEGFKN